MFADRTSNIAATKTPMLMQFSANAPVEADMSKIDTAGFDLVEADNSVGYYLAA